MLPYKSDNASQKLLDDNLLIPAFAARASSIGTAEAGEPPLIESSKDCLLQTDQAMFPPFLLDTSIIMLRLVQAIPDPDPDVKGMI